MRIALIITELNPGGAEKCLTQLACYLARKSNDVKVFSLQSAPTVGQDQLLSDLATAGVSIAFGNASSSWSFLATQLWLRSELKSFTPDIAQSMLFHANILAALAVGPLETALIGGVRVRQPERWRWWLERLASKRMCKVVCVSDDVAEHCKNRERIPVDKLVTIPNGIDLALVERAATEAVRLSWSDFGLPRDANVLLFVGRLHSQKGIEELVARADDLLGKLPQYHLVLMGAGPLQIKLRSLIAALSAADRIHLVGWQSNALAWMQRAQLLLLPAAYEGMPNVVLEAMASGLPFVAFDVDGVQQLIGDDPLLQKQIVAPKSYSAFIDTAQRLAIDPTARRVCGDRNRMRILQHFELDTQLEKYLKLYRSFI